jgi:purine-nucleoside phosphorylase
MIDKLFEETLQCIKKVWAHPIDVVAILGSGLGDLALSYDIKTVIPYAELPHFAQVGVAGHSGNLVLTQNPSGKTVAFLQGRFHSYEGHDANTVLFPLRVLRLMGAHTLVVTNSAGGINETFLAGDLMLLTDHINFTGQNPLQGPNPTQFGERFFDMSAAYTPCLQQLAQQEAKKLGIQLHQGVYVGVSGPSYETPAEVKMFRLLGGDAVGMSTVNEVIAASHMKMKVLGMSLISNPAAGVMSGHTLSHQEVLEAGNQAKEAFSSLMSAILEQL